MTNQPPYNQPPNNGNYQQPAQPPYGNYPPPPQNQPYGNYQQPGVSYSPPPPPAYTPKKSKAGLIIGIILGIFGLFIVAAIVGFVFLFSAGSSAKTDGEKVVTEFMSALGSGNVAKAHTLLSPDFRQEFSVQDMQGQLSSNSFIKSYTATNFNTFSFNSNNGVENLQLGGTANFGSTGTSNVEYTLRKVSGEGWRITKFSIRPPA
jgi:hypothetical protein